MDQVTIDWRTMVRRSVAATVTLPVLICAASVVYVTLEISGLEYSYAVGVSDQTTPTDLSQLYRNLYGWGWLGPVVGATAAIALLIPRRAYLVLVICYVNSLLLFTTIWLMFACGAFYLQNQTFWGWPRVQDGSKLFVEKGKPGTGARVPGGTDLESGELYMGKLGEPGMQNILRRAAGTYHKETNDEKENDKHGQEQNNERALGSGKR